jgi:hypothetical protein
MGHSLADQSRHRSMDTLAAMSAMGSCSKTTRAKRSYDAVQPLKTLARGGEFAAVTDLRLAPAR